MIEAHISIRDFLLFLPASAPGLNAVLQYYTSTISINAEGDTQLSDENIAGLGTAPTFISSLFDSIFGSVAIIAKPPPKQTRDRQFHPYHQNNQQPDQDSNIITIISPEFSSKPSTVIHPSHESSKHLEEYDFFQSHDGRLLIAMPCGFRHIEPDFPDNIEITISLSQLEKSRLTGFAPSPGYFLAGGVAGAVSRTATAPLDRAKVYLIANTSPADLKAVKENPWQALKTFGRPLKLAFVDLWKAGGVRSLFAGEYSHVNSTTSGHD